MKKRVLLIAAAVCMVLVTSVALSYPATSSAVGEPWWDTKWSYRVGVNAGANGYAREDKPVEVDINFTDLLDDLGDSGALDVNSIRVVEINAGGTVIDAGVPFQFDKANSYNAATNASGTLIFLMKDSTGSSATRSFHVYFDLAGESFTPPSFTPLVNLTDNVTHKGYASVQIETAGAEYFYHKPGGGFATLMDKDNKDWLGWGPLVDGVNGEANDFRGIPNMVHPQDGGYFHPGRSTASTTVLNEGPLKATFKSVSDNNAWEVLWEVFPAYARMTILKVDAAKNYWLLYEGTPGGALDTGSDTLTRSDETTILASETWTTDIPGEEWIFVTDHTVDRSIYLIHHQQDEQVDGYYPSNPNNLMTIFGFGRSGNSRFLNGLPRQFTFGLIDATTVGPVRTAVRNAYKPLTITLTTPEEQPGGVDTPTPTGTAVPTSIATPTATASPSPTATQAPVCSEAFCNYLPYISSEVLGER